MQDKIKKALELEVGVLNEDFLIDSLAAGRLEDQSFYRLSLKQIERDEDKSDTTTTTLQPVKEKSIFTFSQPLF